MIRFLADENMPRPSVRLLRDNGHEVESVQEDDPGLEDDGVLARAVRGGQVLLTFDADHGRLIFHEGHPPPVGVVRFRLPDAHRLEAGERLLALLADPAEALEGWYVTVERDRVRRRAFPRAW
jgi:predicted nuclease of predicted toxin-antitoxin system